MRNKNINSKSAQAFWNTHTHVLSKFINGKRNVYYDNDDHDDEAERQSGGRIEIILGTFS
jgi:hypothetical protein